MEILLKLFPVIYQWTLLFHPYQSLAYFRTLLDFAADLTLYRNASAQRKVYLLYLILVMYALQNLYLWAFLPPPMVRLRQADLISRLSLTDSFYLVQVSLSFMTGYFIHVLCFTMKASFLRLLEDTLFRDTTRTLSGVAYGRYSEQATARIVILVLVNCLHVFMLVADGVILCLGYYLISTAIESPGELLASPLDTPLSFIWNVLHLILGTWTSVIGIALYSKLCINAAALGAGQVGVLFRRLHHSETLLGGYRRKDGIFSWAPFRAYLLYSGQTFRLLFISNGIFGRLFLAFLLVNMPISAWALMELALGDLRPWSSITLPSMPAHELLCCILIHWALAKFTKRLHAPSKTLLTLNAATGHRMGNFRARLLLHHTIVRLHTKAKYGFTYGSVGGLITMGSFGKCMLLYIELLMYAYKLIRDI